MLRICYWPAIFILQLLFLLLRVLILLFVFLSQSQLNWVGKLWLPIIFQPANNDWQCMLYAYGLFGFLEIFAILTLFPAIFSLLVTVFFPPLFYSSTILFLALLFSIYLDPRWVSFQSPSFSLRSIEFNVISTLVFLWSVRTLRLLDFDWISPMRILSWRLVIEFGLWHK